MIQRRIHTHFVAVVEGNGAANRHGPDFRVCTQPEPLCKHIVVDNWPPSGTVVAVYKRIGSCASGDPAPVVPSHFVTPCREDGGALTGPGGAQVCRGRDCVAALPRSNGDLAVPEDGVGAGCERLRRRRSPRRSAGIGRVLECLITGRSACDDPLSADPLHIIDGKVHGGSTQAGPRDAIGRVSEGIRGAGSAGQPEVAVPLDTEPRDVEQ